jgi:NitT/TauT family transport system substrate-binding protein
MPGIWNLRIRTLVLFAAFVLCAGQPAAQAQEMQKVSVRMDWVISAYHAPYFVGIVNGFYKAEGLDVTVDPGNGSANVAQAIGNGVGQFGMVDGGTMMQLIAKGLPVKSIMGIYQRNPIGAIYNAKSGIQKPKDLEGKTLVVTHGDAPSALLPAFVKAAGVDMTKINIIGTDAASKNAAVISGRADAAVTFSFLAMPLMEAAGLKVGTLDFADHGVNVPGLTLIANTTFIEKNPELVRKFVRATVKAFEWSVANPQKAIDILIAANPSQKISVPTARPILEASFALLTTKRTKGKPLGITDREDWVEAENILAEYVKMPKAASVDRYFTNEFVAGK